MDNYGNLGCASVCWGTAAPNTAEMRCCTGLSTCRHLRRNRTSSGLYLINGEMHDLVASAYDIVYDSACLGRNWGRGAVHDGRNPNLCVHAS